MDTHHNYDHKRCTMCSLRESARRIFRISIMLIAGAFLTQTGSRFLVDVQAQGRNSKKTDLQSRYAVHPEVDRLRRRLGQRFQEPGREIAVLNGTLTIGADRLPIQIARLQDEQGENVAISLAGGQLDFAWTGPTGPLARGAAVTDASRALIERIVFDSADQFIQGQVRGDTYRTIARRVRAGSYKDGSNYAGPLWDLVRVEEPKSGKNFKPLSAWRLYYINCSTGLIDKVVSAEPGDIVIAEFGGWTAFDGELEPTQIQWSRNGQVVMRLTVESVARAPKQ